MASAPYRSWVEVSCATIAANYRAIKALVGPAIQVMPVVKADAYRHGAVEVVRVLEREGVSWLAVSSVDEGVQLRESGCSARILVMADFLPCEREALLDYSLTPVIHSLHHLRALEALAAQRGGAIPYHLKLDTGMTRLGTLCTAVEIAAAAAAAPHTVLEGLMTHFASAARYDRRQTDEQLRQFGTLREQLAQGGLRPVYTHLAATIPVAYGRSEAWGNMVRPGHAIYGYVSPLRGNGPEPSLDVRPALEWKAAILETKTVPSGTPVGYGAMYRTPAPMRIGVLAVGYADGLPHRLSNRGFVIAAGTIVPILGAVSMDLTTIDLTPAPSLQVGDCVTLLGHEGDARIDAQQIARQAGTISYSVLCGISARVRRIYL